MRCCQAQEDCSLEYLKDSLKRRKILTFTCTIGCEAKYPLESPRTSHLVEFFQQCHHSAWAGKRTGFVMSTPRCGWDSQNYSSYHEHKEQADKVLQTEINKGYVQWSASRDELEHEVGTLQLVKIAVIVKGEKVRLIHDMRRNGTNAKVVFHERLVLPRLRDVVQGVMVLLENKANHEGIEFLTLDFRDAFKQLHVVASERPYLAGAAMGGFFSYRTVLFGVGSGPLVWCRVAAWVMRSTQAWLTSEHAQTNCFVDDPIISLKGTPEPRRVLAMGVLLWWSSLGLKLACEKGSFGSEVVWIGTHLVVNSMANKVEVRLPAKKNLEILATLSDLMDGPGAIIKHDEVRKVAGKESWVASFLPQLKPFVRQLWASLFTHSTGDKVNFVYKRQVWPALSWLRRFHGHQRGELVRHLFLVDQLLDGLVLEVDASTTGGGAACWHGDRRRSRREPPDAFVFTQWTPEDEQLLLAVRGDPAHQATWEALYGIIGNQAFCHTEIKGKNRSGRGCLGSMVQFGSDEG